MLKMCSKRLLLFAFGAACCAQDIRPLSVSGKGQRDAVFLTGFEYVIPQLIIGGEWTSTIRLTNRGTRAIPSTNVAFIDNNGNSMPATFRTTSGNVITDTGFSFSLPVGGFLEAQFIGDANTRFGHGGIACSAAGCGTSGLYAEVALRNRNPVRSDFESVFPLETPALLQYMLFDGRNGLTTTLYVVNSNNATNVITIDLVDPGNRLIQTASLLVKPFETRLGSLHDLFPETIGIQGTLVFRSTSSGSLIVVTALRINPTNSFTPVRAFVPTP